MIMLSQALDTAIKTIPTYYSGIKFRSRLEASYAKAMDAISMRWVYEPQGYEIDDTFYLPDFWIPQIRTFLEIKGPLVPGLEKAEKLYAHLNLGRPDEEWSFPLYSVVWGDEFGTIRNFIDHDACAIAQCGGCGEFWFMPWGASYQCRSCGLHDGDHHILNTFDRFELEQINFIKGR